MSYPNTMPIACELSGWSIEIPPRKSRKSKGLLGIILLVLIFALVAQVQQC